MVSSEPETGEVMSGTMPKESVIWPANYAKDEKKLHIKDATEAKLEEARAAITAKLGWSLPTTEFTEFVKWAKQREKRTKELLDFSSFNPNEAYVKVGVVNNNLVFRAKQPKTLGDVENDLLLVTNYPAATKLVQQRKSAVIRANEIKVKDMYTNEAIRKEYYAYAKTHKVEERARPCPGPGGASRGRSP